MLPRFHEARNDSPIRFDLNRDFPIDRGVSFRSQTSDTFPRMTRRDSLVELGARISGARRSAGMKQGDLSLLIGISQSTVSQYEAGKGGRPDRDTIATIEKACGLEPGELERGLDFDEPGRPRPTSFPMQLAAMQDEVASLRQGLAQLEEQLARVLSVLEQSRAPKRPSRPATPPPPPAP